MVSFLVWEFDVRNQMSVSGIKQNEIKKALTIVLE